MEDKLRKVYDAIRETNGLKDDYQGMTYGQFREFVVDKKVQDDLYQDLVDYDLATPVGVDEYWIRKGLRTPQAPSQSVQTPTISQPNQPAQPQFGQPNSFNQFGQRGNFLQEIQSKEKSQSPVVGTETQTASSVVPKLLRPITNVPTATPQKEGVAALPNYKGLFDSPTAKQFSDTLPDDKYRYGAKDIKGKDIDCSGAVCHVLKIKGIEYNPNTTNAAKLYSSAKTKNIPVDKSIDGDIIVMDIEGKGIDHIGFVVRDKDGNLGIAESSSSYNGTTITPFKERIENLKQLHPNMKWDIASVDKNRKEPPASQPKTGTSLTDMTRQQVVTPMKEPQPVKPVEEKKADRFITSAEKTVFGVIPFVTSAIKSVKGFFGNETGVEKGKKVAVNPSPLKAYEEAQTQYRDADKQYQELEKQSKAAGQGLQYGDYDFGTQLKLSKEIPGLKTNAEKSLLGAGPTIDKIIDDAYKNADESKFMDYNPSTKKRIVSLDKIQNLSREIAKKSGLPETGYAQQRIASQMKAYVEHKQIEPDVEKEVFSLLGNQTPKNLAQKEFEKVVKENTKIQGLKTQAEIEQKVVADQLNVEQKAITSQYEKDYKTLVADLNKESAADPEIDALRKTIIAEDKQTAKQIHEKYQQLVNSNKMTVIQATAARDKEYELFNDPKKLEEKKQRINALAKQKYGAKYANAFQQYTNALNETSTRFNRRYKREATEIVGLANAKINSELEAVKKQYKTNPETVEKIKAAYKEAYAKVLKEKDLKEFADDQSLGFWNQLANSTISSFGAGVSGYATTFGLGKVAQLGDVISNNYHPSNIAVTTKEDWLDPIKAAHGTGDILGRMVPSLIVGATTAAATQGAGVPLAVRLMLTGFADMMAESADISGTIYKQMLDKTGSAVDAGNAARDAFEGNLYNYPAYVVGSLPFFANALKGVPGLTGVLGRTAFGAGLEMVTETYTESVQGAQEKSILAGERLKDTFKELTIEHILDTGLQMAPIAILGGAPHLFQGGRDIIEKNFADRAVKAFRAKEVLSTELNDENQAQFFAQIHNEKGAAFAKSMLGSLFIDGKITPEQNERLSGFINNYDTWSPQAKKLGLNGTGAKIGGILFNDLEQAKASADPQLIKEAQSAFDNFLKTGNAELISVGLSDGSTYFYKPAEFSRMLDTPDFQQLIQDRSVKLSGMSSNMGTGEYKSLIEKVDMVGKAAKPAASVVEYVTVTDDELNAFKQGQVDPERLAGVQEDADAVRNGEMTLEDLPEDPNYRIMVQMQLEANKQQPNSSVGKTFTLKDTERISDGTGLQRKGSLVNDPELVAKQLSVGDKLTFFQERERTGTWDGNKIIEDGTNNPWGLLGVLSDGWVINNGQQTNDNTNAGTGSPNVDAGVVSPTGSENVVIDAGVVPASNEGGTTATTEAQPATVPLPQVEQTQPAQQGAAEVAVEPTGSGTVEYLSPLGGQTTKSESRFGDYKLSINGDKATATVESNKSTLDEWLSNLTGLAKAFAFKGVTGAKDFKITIPAKLEKDKNGNWQIIEKGQLEWIGGNQIDAPLNTSLPTPKKSPTATPSSLADQITDLRAKEQAELDSKIKNADKYRGADGRVDRKKLNNDADRAAYDEVYNKFNKPISDLLAQQEKEEAPAPKAKPNPFIEKTRKAFNAALKKLGLKAKVKFISDEEAAEIVGDSRNKFQIVGETGVARMNNADAILKDLSVAKKMEKAGKDAKAIRMATGWEKGVDGKWRYEIPDNIKINTKRYNSYQGDGPPSLDVLIDAPEIFAAYPFLKDVKVNVFYYGSDAEHSGAYFPKENTIYASGRTMKEARSALIHEIQHVIQDEEGFASGGNELTIARRLEVIKNQMAEVHKLKNIWQNSKGKRETKKNLDIHNKALSKIDWKEYFLLEQNLPKIFQRDNISSYTGYTKLAGEVESRNVENRLKMSPEERRATLLAETEDVARDQQIVLFDAFESRQSIGAGFQTRDGKPIGFAYDTDQVARGRFDFSKLKKIGSGSDRDVYNLGDGKVLKVAKTARGLTQNIYEGDFYLKGIIPEVFERGLNYVVAENTPKMKAADVVETFDEDGNVIGKTTAGKMLSDLSAFSQKDFDNKTSKLQDVLTKYGLQDIMSYDVLWPDFTAPRNWGYKDGKAYHSDGGTFGGVDMIDSYKNKTNLSDPEFRKIYEESKRLKKQFGDTDKNTMYMRGPLEPSGIPLTETDLLVAAKPRDILENLNRYSLEQMVQFLKQNDPNGAYQDFLDEDEFSYDEGLQAARESVERMFEDYDPLDMQQKLKWMDLTYKKKSPFAPSKFAENNESEEGGKVVPLFMKDAKGTILGFVQPQPDGSYKVWIDPATTNAETPIHELAGHIFMPLLKEAAPELHAKGVELIQNTSYMDNAKALGLEGAAASEEALAQAIGEKGKQLTESKRKDFLDWLNGMWKKIGEKLGITKPIKDLTLEEFTDLIAGSIVFGKQFEMKGEAGRDARAELKDNVGPEEFKRMEDIHRNGEKMLKEMESKGLIKIDCP